MNESKILVCPYCHNNYFHVKYESSFVYSYVIDSDAPGLKNTDEFLSFQYDNREHKDARQYLECQSCWAQFPCSFNQWDKNMGIKDLQAVIDKGGNL
ncbi:hypothetical protein [Sinanaerobacter chloroacetimidivorans]|jgi:uncharacterized protein YbaR (Trm112 family)|uniref:Uncharacterized protein n=1 Tax=Sinanaerobacter chloroacetimidivorans TaxID=2818044 RepID=A0A8J8B4B8_9FIRM|nr:hypothetical protein [Sinanaerobacter chloroacetimidivorans]MBR0600611.1 hypothetical protein [Sinanaerobacter chloroacetimidivorans]